MFAATSGKSTQMLTGALPAHLVDKTCQVTLIDRRTGRAHRVQGYPVMRFTTDPHAAARDLLLGRDANLWEARIEPLAP